MNWNENIVEYCVSSIKNNTKTVYELSQELNKSPQSIRAKLRRCGYLISSLIDYSKTIGCLNCNTLLTIGRTEKTKFCSRSCSVSYNNVIRIRTDDSKNKTSNSVKRYWDVNNDAITAYLSNPNFCSICDSELSYNRRNKSTCSAGCLDTSLSKAGRKSSLVQSENRRSKNEKLFAEKCISHFNTVLVNEPMFNGWDADVIIDDIKVAVLWNGKWHYEKITEKHSVKQVQNRDKIKIKEIKKCGYTPYVIKDLGKFNEEFVNTEFSKFIIWLQTKK